MKPVKQRFKHDPANGVYGDCHRAAIASIFELELDDVPHFGDGYPPAEEFWCRVYAFTETLGFTAISIPFVGDGGIDGVQATLKISAPNVYYLFGGTSKTGVGHTVVGCGGEIVHDPSQVNSGIVGPMEDGLYWVTFFVPKDLPRAIVAMRSAA